MKNDRFVSIEDVSDFFDIAVDVLKEWAEHGLLTLFSRGEAEGVDAGEIASVERIASLYRDLGVNREGIEIILSMRDRIMEMSRELDSLRGELQRRQNDHRLRYVEIPEGRGLLVDYSEEDE